METDIKYIHRYSKMDLIVELLSLLFILGNFYLIITSLSVLPDTIPNHFNFSGQADGYGSKHTIWGPFVFSLFLYTLLTFLSRKPDFNKASMKKQDRNEEYKMTVKMILSIKCILMAVMFVITYFMIQTAQLKLTQYLHYLVIAILVSVLSHVGYWIYRHSRLV